MRSWFDTTVAVLQQQLRPQESFALWFAAEESDFVRLNHGRIRQAGFVRAAHVRLQLMRAGRSVTGRLTLQGQPAADRERLAGWVQDQREHLAVLPSDPHLIVPDAVHSSELVEDAPLPDSSAAMEEIVNAAEDLDLVGLYARGPLYRGFANSQGQCNWMHRGSVHFDWSLYAHGDRSVKDSYAGAAWDGPTVRRKLHQGQERLAIMQQPVKTLAPGHYRAYLAPAAVGEVLSTAACWGGFSLRAHRDKTSILQELSSGQKRLHPAVTLREDSRHGFAPLFQEQGFIRPEVTTLVREGVAASLLTGPRSAREYGVACNGASEGEMPAALDLAAGQLPQQDILAELETGLYVGNLWYLNPSDAAAGRLTGMTRFFTCWVQNGKWVGPVAPMRFDDTVYHLLGEHLAGLTRERERILDSSTYSERSTASMHLPGILLSDLCLTL